MKKITLTFASLLLCIHVLAQDTIQAKFTVVDVCDGDEAVFTNTSKVPVKFGGANYFWYFGDGSTSTDQFPKHTYTKQKPGEEERFEVKLVVQSKSIPSEKDSTTAFITIFPNPDATFTWDVNNKGNTQDVIIATQATTDTANFYQWNLAGVLKSNEVTPVFVHDDVQPYLDGKNYDFSLLVRTPDGCESTYKTTFNYNPLSVQILIQVTGLMYPNPATKEVHFKKHVSEIVISDMSGKIVYKHADLTNLIVLDGLSGVYSLTANLNGKTVTQKLLVQ